MANRKRIWFSCPRGFTSLRVRRAIAGIALLAVAVGCGPKGYEQKTPDDSRKLRGIIRTYETAARDLGRPPKNIDELVNVLAPASKDPLGLMTSTRDGEVFVTVWGLRLSSSPPDTIVAYERTGVKGKRMVLNRHGIVKEVTEQEFAALKFPDDHIPGGD